METKIDIIDVDSNNKGLMVVTSKQRKIVAMVEKQPRAREEDTMMLMQEMKNTYTRYLQRVHEYSL